MYETKVTFLGYVFYVLFYVAYITIAQVGLYVYFSLHDSTLMFRYLFSLCVKSEIEGLLLQYVWLICLFMSHIFSPQIYFFYKYQFHLL